MGHCLFTATRTERVVSYAPVIQSSCTMAMASVIPVEDSPITSVKIKTRLADGWIHYQELVGYIMLEPVFFPGIVY